MYSFKILKLSTCSATNLPNFYFTRVAEARCESPSVTLGSKMASQEQSQVTSNLTQEAANFSSDWCGCLTFSLPHHRKWKILCLTRNKTCTNKIADSLSETRAFRGLSSKFERNPWIVIKYFRFCFVLSTLVAKYNSPLSSVALQMLNVLFFLYFPNSYLWLQLNAKKKNGRRGQLVSLLRFFFMTSDLKVKYWRYFVGFKGKFV